MRVVIVGGVAGGMSVAARLRRLDAEAEIVVLERSRHVSYANCGLPYYIGGVIEEEASLLLQTPESLHDRFRIDVRVCNEALAIDRQAKKVKVRDRATGDEYAISYDKLVLSPGAGPVIPPIPGIERARTLRCMEDVRAIFDELARQPESAVVIGGGFIGVEIAENLVRLGVGTAIVEATPQLLAPLDPEMARPVADEMRRNGVRLHLGESVDEVRSGTVRLSNDTELAADLVVLAIGVRPETSLAEAACLKVGRHHGVIVDDVNRTSDPSIYAIGDVVEQHHAIDGSPAPVPLANIANRQGRVVADHIAGRVVRAVPAIGTTIVKVFDLVVAVTGWNEKQLARGGRDFLAIHTHPLSHAGFYPGAQSMAIKMLVDPNTSRILGAQVVGKEGVDKRIDVIATAMRANLTAPELADLELAYAPQFGSAKDAVNMLGYVAENRLSRLEDSVQWNEVENLRREGYTILDVRTAEEFQTGALLDAVNIPIDEIRERTSEIPSRDVIVCCQVGTRAHTAALLLVDLGFRARILDGGYETWSHSPAAALPQLVS